MKNFLLLLLLLPAIGFGQTKKMYVEGTPGEYYLTHTTGPKENFYSIGRLYNISPRVYAPFNNLQLEGGLSIGQVVKIPLTETNYSKSGEAHPDEVIIPLYSKAGSKENLTGYLVVKKEVSALSSRGAAPKSIRTANPEPETVKADPPAKPAVPEPQKEIKADPPVKTTASEPVTKTEPVKEAPAVPEIKPTQERKDFKGGFFRNVYLSHVQTEKNIPANGGTFKSTSGWNDGKYYCFHNSALAGSIVMITNPENGRAVYAKVLDVIPDISKNKNIDIRLSNAAADELGISAENFSCILSY